jgi:hypothetical protein
VCSLQHCPANKQDILVPQYNTIFWSGPGKPPTLDFHPAGMNNFTVKTDQLSCRQPAIQTYVERARETSELGSIVPIRCQSRKNSVESIDPIIFLSFSHQEVDLLSQLSREILDALRKNWHP